MSTTLIPPGIPVTPLERERQRLEALESANRIRLGRAALLQRLFDRSPVASVEMAIEMIQDPPEVLAGLRVECLLLRVRRLGPVLARKVLQAAEVDGSTVLAELGEGGRVRLVTALQLRARLG